MAVQKKQSVVPPSQGPLSSRTIQSQRRAKRPERKRENVSKPEPHTKTAICSFNKSAQINSTLSPRAAAANGQNVDERLKAARERREENQKILASRELSRLEREQRARRYYEQQLQERKKKLMDQRLKEERRRAAVEEKRKQRLREERERYESAVRKTLEKSQKAQQTLSQITRGRKLNKNASRRSPLTTWERNLVSRLLTPTCSYLARSRSAACQSGQEAVHVCRRAVSFHSMNTTSTSTTTHKPLLHSGSGHHRSTASPGATNNRPGSVGVPQTKVTRHQDRVKKTAPGSANRSTPVKTLTRASTVGQRNAAASPSPDRTPRRPVSRHPTPMQLELPSVPEEDAAAAAVCPSALSAGNARPVRKPGEGRRESVRRENPPETAGRDKEAQTRRTAGDGSPAKTAGRSPPPEVTNRPSAGTTDPNEASRLLAERRREARLQREKEEQERLQREEAERRSREELERRRAEERQREAEERARREAEERARREAEAQRLLREKRLREEEEQRRAEEERALAMREAALLQKQREEEQARENAAQQQREIVAQKEEADRQARKKRLEEIMRRTRRTDSPDMKSVPVRILPNEAKPKENTEPALSPKAEEAVRPPAGTKAQPGLSDDEDVVPVVAFKERRSLRTLSGLEEIQTHQRAEVI